MCIRDRAQARAALGEFAHAHHIPVENLLSPDSLRRMLWTPPVEPTLESISETLLKLGARQWQIDSAGPIVEQAINRPAALAVEPTVELTATATTEPR